jgi:hypothetical protein
MRWFCAGSALIESSTRVFHPASGVSCAGLQWFALVLGVIPNKYLILAIFVRPLVM